MTFREKIVSCITFIFDTVYAALLEYAKVVLLVIIIIVSAQVASRKFLGTSIRWSEEVALFLMIWLAFIAMAIGVEQHLHIAIEMFAKLCPKIIQTIIGKINDGVTFGFGLILVVYGSKLVSTTMTSTLPATQWPAGLEYLMMPVSGIFIMYFSFLSLFGLEKYRHIKRSAHPATPEAQ
jgi:TRAP-type C4-dicarboxylate transport system permease small subunit